MRRDYDPDDELRTRFSLTFVLYRFVGAFKSIQTRGKHYTDELRSRISRTFVLYRFEGAFESIQMRQNTIQTTVERASRARLCCIAL